MSTQYEATGRLKVLGVAKKVSERFRVREFVLEIADNPEYPQLVSFQLTQDRCEDIDGWALNDTLKVAFNLRGREWTSPQGEVRYFNSLEAWRLSPAGDSTQQSLPAGMDESDVYQEDIPF